jgi:DNA-binding transcriptional regulator GbsR (MarR family)
MHVSEGTERFIEAWGRMAGEWGINRTMAQVHALLLVSLEPLTADQVKEKLAISTGNASMNLRALMDWGLAYKHLKPGDRKEYYTAEKDIWNVVRQIIIQRKKRELDPMIKILEEVAGVEQDSAEAVHFASMVSDIRKFSHKAHQTLDALTKSDSGWFTNTFLTMLR